MTTHRADIERDALRALDTNTEPYLAIITHVVGRSIPVGWCRRARRGLAREHRVQPLAVTRAIPSRRFL
ncbi:hypothetical protein [Embleya sp. NPDC005971]|uniref:hypothetical protein n=1 Tax=unclassified Embleya TaxID=2699296 RepID=UPI0033CE738B